MKKTYSQSIANAINNFLISEKRYFNFDEQRGMFWFKWHGDRKIDDLDYFFVVTENEYTVYAYFSLSADENDEKMMATMAEFICYANYGLKNGNFELNMENGEIRYKCFVDCEGGTPTMKEIKNSVIFHAWAFNRYGAGIVDIICGNSTAKEAIVKCEGACG